MTRGPKSNSHPLVVYVPTKSGLRAVVIVCLLFFVSMTVAQSLPGDGQYKRIHQAALQMIDRGDAEQAVTELRAYLETHPDDAESYFMLSLALADLEEVDDAVTAMEEALKLDLPPGRFLVATLPGMEHLREHDAWKELLQKNAHRPVHGPMLGQLSDESIGVWLRTAREADVVIIYGTSPDLADGQRSRIFHADASTDFTVVVNLEGLQPDTQYHYAVEIDGQQVEEAEIDSKFRTLSATDLSTPLRIAFGGGAGYVPQKERMWSTIASQEPAALVLLGDNTYSDDPAFPAMQHYCYYRRQSRPEFRSLIAGTPVYAIWDDHDFGTDDCAGGPEIESPPWKRPVWEVFRNNWANAYYGGGTENPGCWFDFHLGDVHFIMLDGRYYRSDHRHPDSPRSMLGPVQMAWLKQMLADSEGTFKILCSPVPWTFEAKGNSPDTWNGFQEERHEIFEFLRYEEIEGVVLMSADRHRSDLWRIEHEGLYDLFELNSSRLTNQHVHPEMQAAEFSYNDKQSFGLVDFDFSGSEPTLTYRIVNIDGDEVFAFELGRADLEFD